MYSNPPRHSPARATSLRTPEYYQHRVEQTRIYSGSGGLLPAFVEESRPSISTTDDEDDFESEERARYKALQVRKREERARRYANISFLAPPQPNQHRNLNQQDAERQRRRRYEGEPVRVNQQPHYGGNAPRSPLSRSASLPVTQASPNRSESAIFISKARRNRPNPIELPPPLHRPYVSASDESAASSPYSESIFSLYSPSASLSPNPRTRSESLPIYRFQPSDLPPLPGQSRVSNPFTLSPLLSSSSSTFMWSPQPGSASSESSMSSFRQDVTEVAMPTPPLPAAAPKQRIHTRLSPNMPAGQNSRIPQPRYI